jgi:hypothetical protein
LQNRSLKNNSRDLKRMERSLALFVSQKLSNMRVALLILDAVLITCFMESVLVCGKRRITHVHFVEN